MAEPVPEGGERTTKYFAPKNKNCQYCGQNFTSSSLGRHLDLWIRPVNPRAPDGVHDVDEIRRTRGSVTRRQMTMKRPSTNSLRSVSTPATTPVPVRLRRSSARTSAARKALPEAPNSISAKSPAPVLPKDGEYAVDSKMNRWPCSPGFEVTGVLNNIPHKTPEVSHAAEAADATQDLSTRPDLQRQLSRQMFQKAQLDVKQRLTDAVDTARAGELALREIISSWRAAKVQIDSNSMPFDFDPLSLDFPALTLRCLQAPPTLFSSTQHPTSTSWSVQYPGRREFDALTAFFDEHFTRWKATCAAATTASMEELLYPPRKGPLSSTKEAVKKSLKQAEIAAQQVTEHLESSYTVWSELPEQRQNELWVLELARSVGRRQKEIESMKETQHKLQQEVHNLKSQVEQMSRLQQPREFKLMAPANIPFDPDLVNHVLRTGLQGGGRGVGFEMEDKNLDLSEIVSRSIERWKAVITSTRATTGGMSAQRPLAQTPNATPVATPTPLQVPQQQRQPILVQQDTPTQEPPTPQAATVHRRSTNTSATGMSEAAASMTTGPSSVQSSEHDADGDADADADAAVEEEEEEEDEDDADDDADGDMDADMDAEGDADGDVDIAGMDQDDSFSMMATPPAKASHPQQHHMPTLDVPRTRGPMQHHVRDDGQQQYMLQSNMPDTSHLNMARAMPNLQAAMQTLHSNDMGLVMGVRSDHMYLD